MITYVNNFYVFLCHAEQINHIQHNHGPWRTENGKDQCDVTHTEIHRLNLQLPACQTSLQPSRRRTDTASFRSDDAAYFLCSLMLDSTSEQQFSATFFPSWQLQSPLHPALPVKLQQQHSLFILYLLMFTINCGDDVDLFSHCSELYLVQITSSIKCCKNCNFTKCFVHFPYHTFLPASVRL